MTKKISKVKRRYLIALIQGRTCPKCSRPMYAAPGFKSPEQCWRCYLRYRGIPKHRVWEQVNGSPPTPHEQSVNRDLYQIMRTKL